MSIKVVAKRVMLMLGLVLAPVVYSTEICEEFRKQVSVDGGNNWLEADDPASAPDQAVGGAVVYRFIVKNCETNKKCFNTIINDPTLNIINADVPDGDDVIDPLEEIIITKDDAGFENLDQPGRCDTPGVKENTATETTTTQGSPTPESFENSAYVNCVEPPIAKLGDRVWEDFDGDGVQDCDDTNNDQIIGNDGDIGAECGAGIPDVPVNLLLPGNDGVCNSGDDTVLMSTSTNIDGFYLFDELVAGTYCVEFGKPTDDFCVDEATGIALGSPLFTQANAGGDTVDSDADITSGRTGNIDLSAGETDRTIDAGIVCPVKIGNRVWEDDGDGVQQNGEMDIEGVEVELRGCGPDMVAGTIDDVITGHMRTTDDDGMYMFGGEPNFSLPPDKYYVLFDPSSYPPGYSPTMPNVGPDSLDSDCKAPNGITACTDLTASGSINLDRDCGLIPPQPNCDLVLDKSCRVDAPPPQDFDKCDGKLEQFTVKWTGSDIQISGLPNDSDGNVSNGQEVTFFGPFDSNDVFVTISGAENGQSKFHMSCSDDDFNDPSDCGKAAGNGKDDNSSFINLWELEGFIDKERQVLDCTTSDDGGFTDNCSFVKPPAPSCETTGKPEALTWRYDGGSCADSTFDVQKDFECSGSVDSSAQVTVIDDQGGSALVNPGQEFTISRDASKEMSLSNGGGTQDLVLHTSCSQPIEAGLTAGALTLVALDGQTGGREVTYRYSVTNSGDPLTGVTVTDDLLGDIGGPIDLATGAGAVFDKTTSLFGTTVNVGTASGLLSNGQACSPDTASDTVTVDVTEPTCDVAIVLDKIEDDKIKWKLANPSNVDATIDSLSISWPGSGELKKIKFDGNDILKDDLRSSPAFIQSSEWLKQVKDRTLKAGESGKKLEFEFTEKFPLKKNQPSGDFDLVVIFEEGCSVSY